MNRKILSRASKEKKWEKKKFKQMKTWQKKNDRNR